MKYKYYQFRVPDWSEQSTEKILDELLLFSEGVNELIADTGFNIITIHRKFTKLLILIDSALTELKKREPERVKNLEQSLSLSSILDNLKIKTNDEKQD